MGIIIGSSKKVFDELIQTSAFDDIYKNFVRDYYTYGFKSYEQFGKSRRTVENNWKVLSRLLGDEWDDPVEDSGKSKKSKNGRKQIVLKTIPTEDRSPMDIFYFLHGISKIGDYLNYLLDLDGKTEWMHANECFERAVDEERGIDSETDEKWEWYDAVTEDCYRALFEGGMNGTVKGGSTYGLDKISLRDFNCSEYVLIMNWLRGEMPAGVQDDDFPACVRINRQLNIWSPGTRMSCTDSSDKYKVLTDRTRELESMGVISRLDKVQKTAWRMREAQIYESWAKESFLLNSVPQDVKHLKEELKADEGTKYWFKSPVTMAEICGGLKTEEESDFREMCEFFSQYYPVGVIGTMLSKRLSCRTCESREARFRFKHNYVQKTLYDYNLVDILYAIQKGCVCEIEYAHGTNGSTDREFILPLEVRISVKNGREYVMYYSIAESSLKAKRLEFIDSIKMYSNFEHMIRIKERVKRCGREEKVLKVLDRDNIDIGSLEPVKETAWEMLKYVWGTDVSRCHIREGWKDELIDVSIPVEFDSKEERYIEGRIMRESRTADAADSMHIFPTKELRTWIRSFYMRVAKPVSFDPKGFCLEQDVTSLHDIYDGQGIRKVSARDNGKKSSPQKKDAVFIRSTCQMKGGRECASYGHAALFNELFSVYAVVLANSVIQTGRAYKELQREKACEMASGGKSDINVQMQNVFEDFLRQNIRQNLDYFEEDEQEKVLTELRTFVESSELVDSRGCPRFITERHDYMYDLLPLTKLECSWLLMVMDDPLAELFLPQERIKEVRQKLVSGAPDSEKMDFSHVTYFDRYISTEAAMNGRQSGSMDCMKIVCMAMKKGYKLNIKHRDSNGHVATIRRYCPAYIEYSRRDDEFRVWSCRAEGRIKIINISRILWIEELVDKPYSLDEQRQKLQLAKEQTMTTVKVEFYWGNRNLPDRILTEFSLWKKRCSYDEDTEKFSMFLEYSTIDEKEIMIRLLSYGPYIKVSPVRDEPNYVCDELVRRVNAQYEIVKQWEIENGTSLGNAESLVQQAEDEEWEDMELEDNENEI